MQLVLSVLCLSLSLGFAIAAPTVAWVDATAICIAGRGFQASELESPYDRLPQAAEKVVRSAVWDLSTMSAGMHIDLWTNSTSISTNMTYLHQDTTMWHFASTGVAGMDAYRWSGSDQAFRWVGTTHTNVYPTSTNTLVTDLPPPEDGAAASLYRLHLPTYNAPVTLHLGFDADATLEPACDALAAPGPVVHYGTSIAQGAVPSRPGHAYTNDAAMRLVSAASRASSAASSPVSAPPILNFGFSGNGVMETTVGEFLVNVMPTPSVFVVDCLPNMQAEEVTQRTGPLVQQLRAAHPSTPIFLVEGTTYGASWLGGSVFKAQQAKRTALRQQYDALVKAGVPNLHYVNGSTFFSQDTTVNPTVGGTHPTDLGSASMAEAWAALLQPFVAGKGKPVTVPTTLRTARAFQATTTTRAARPFAPSRSGQVLQAALALERAVAGLAPADRVAANVKWRPLTELTVRGQAFGAQAPGPFNRLPSSAQGVVREAVWSLSLMSTGVRVFFRSNSTAIALNYTTVLPPDPLWHMPASGTAGADLFVLDDEDTQLFRWCGTVEDLPSAAGKRSVVTLTDQLSSRAEPRTFLLHLPLRNWPAADATVGVLDGATLEPCAADQATCFPAARGSVAWYGTSILQAGVASRPGDAYSNVLSRTLQREVFNFGFAGNGKDEVDVANFLVQAPNISLFILDCLPNLNAQEVTERTGPVVRVLRSALGSSVPIALVEGTTYGDNWLNTSVGINQAAKRTALRQQYDALVKAGVPNLHYVTGDQLFAPLWGALPTGTPTVGGTHPSSLGHREVAKAWEPIIKSLL